MKIKYTFATSMSQATNNGDSKDHIPLRYVNVISAKARRTAVSSGTDTEPGGEFKSKRSNLAALKKRMTHSISVRARTSFKNAANNAQVTP